jgi:8-oxo-dGTP pyrophosphatase MutT (NUDIX family)
MPATPVPAATVILLRDSERSPEVLMIERHAKSEFLPDMYVFPGGRLESQDRALAHRVRGLAPRKAAEALGLEDPEVALGLFVAAIRETFEESGIVLARARGETELLDAARATALARHRLDVQQGHVAFPQLVEAEDLELAADRLAVHAHWITPEPVPRRFDTHFFSALAPAGQLARHDGIEATDHVWIRPEDAIDQARGGKRRMIFPTLCNLQTLAGFADALAAFEASRARPVVTVLPVIVEEDGRRKLRIPADAGYAITEDPAPGGR